MGSTGPSASERRQTASATGRSRPAAAVAAGGDELAEDRQAGGVGVGDVVDQQDRRLRRGQPARPTRRALARTPQPAWPGPGPAAGRRPSRRCRGRRRAAPPPPGPCRAGRRDGSRAAARRASAGRRARCRRPAPAGCGTAGRRGWRRARCRRSRARSPAGVDLGGQRRGEAGLADPAARPTIATAAPSPSCTAAHARSSALELARPPDEGRPPGAADRRRSDGRSPTTSYDRHRRAVLAGRRLRGLDLERSLDQPPDAALTTTVPGRAAGWSFAATFGVWPKARGALVLDGGDEHLTGVDGDAHRQRLVRTRTRAGPKAAGARPAGRDRPGRPGRVVLAGIGIPEPDEDAVALVLGDEPPWRATTGCARLVVGAAGSRSRTRRPARCDRLCRSDDVAEHDGEEPTLAGLVRAAVRRLPGSAWCPHHGRGRPFPA